MICSSKRLLDIRNLLTFSFLSSAFMFTSVWGKVIKEGVVDFPDSLYSDTLQLEEAVITVPFGQVKKSTFTGVAQVVTAKELAPRVNTSFVNKLDGIIPGLELAEATGRPGASAAILDSGACVCKWRL